jgi:hypothetical protein
MFNGGQGYYHYVTRYLENYTIWSPVVCTLHQIMENEMGGACSTRVSVKKCTERNLAVYLEGR